MAFAAELLEVTEPVPEIVSPAAPADDTVKVLLPALRVPVRLRVPVVIVTFLLAVWVPVPRVKVAPLPRVMKTPPLPAFRLPVPDRLRLPPESGSIVSVPPVAFSVPPLLRVAV